MQYKLLLLLLLLLLLPVSSNAEEKKIWINTGGFSYHVNRNGNFNESNNGIGLEYILKDNHFVSAGRYYNSIFETSHYLLYGRKLAEKGVFKFGIAGGILDGYMINDGGFIPVVFPYISAEYNQIGANLIFIPGDEKNVSSAFAVVFKFKIRWR